VEQKLVGVKPADGDEHHSDLLVEEGSVKVCRALLGRGGHPGYPCGSH
jgi:hypothetical protein